MASFLSRAVAVEQGEHAQVQANQEWKALAGQTVEALWALYQSVGTARLEGPRA